MLRDCFSIQADWRDWHTYSFLHLYGISDQDAQAALVKQGCLENAMPEPGALEAVRSLIGQGYKVEIWTARAWHPRGQQITEQWFEKWGSPNVTVRVCPYNSSKASLIRQTGIRPKLFVDDSLTQILSVQAESPETSCYVIDRPWNKTAAKLMRFDAVHAAVRHHTCLYKRPEQTKPMHPFPS